jgi:hypothetical protein
MISHFIFCPLYHCHPSNESVCGGRRLSIEIHSGYICQPKSGERNAVERAAGHWLGRPQSDPRAASGFERHSHVMEADPRSSSSVRLRSRARAIRNAAGRQTVSSNTRGTDGTDKFVGAGGFLSCVSGLKCLKYQTKTIRAIKIVPRGFALHPAASRVPSGSASPRVGDF